jgi:hypothetical protein
MASFRVSGGIRDYRAPIPSYLWWVRLKIKLPLFGEEQVDGGQKTAPAATSKPEATQSLSVPKSVIVWSPVSCGAYHDIHGPSETCS